MGRKQYKHLKLTCHRGINQQRGLATLEECAEASNVWAPDGVVEQRPGYVGVTSFIFPDCSDRTSTSTTNTFVTDDGNEKLRYPHTGTMELDAWAVNEHWLIGFDKVSGTYSGITGERSLIGFDTGENVGNANANQIRYEARYYNGTEFVPLRVIERHSIADTISRVAISPHLSDSDGSIFAFCPPGDWASTTISSTAAFWIKFTLKTADGSASAMDGTVRVTNSASAPHIISTQHNVMRGLFAGQFPSTRRYVAVSNNPATNPHKVVWLIASDHEFADVTQPDPEQSPYYDEEPATHAVVPQFGEGYIAYGGRVKIYTLVGAVGSTLNGTVWPDAAADVGNLSTATDAGTEQRDFAIGDEAPFDPDYILTEDEWPDGKYICYFKNRLWVAGSKDQPYTVRWSAAVPYQRVWTSLANDILMEDDNSPITGLASIGEHLVVFKRDSIWLMVPVGENPVTQITDFRGRRIVEGVGCVSNSSIQQVRGRLIFLAEDGVYAFDGTANIQKLSDRIENTVSSIDGGMAAFAVSAHWKTKSCYLLSVPTKGSRDNNRVLVYDYRNDAWWIWNIPIALFMNDEGKGDEERLFFVDNDNCMHELGVGNTDHGQAITSKVVTQRIGETDNIRRTVRQVEIVSDNRTSSLTVAVRANDDSNGDDSGTLSLTDDSEAKYADTVNYPTGSPLSPDTKYVLDRNRARRLSFRKQGDWLQVFVSHDTHNTPMKLRVIDVGIIDGTRR